MSPLTTESYAALLRASQAEIAGLPLEHAARNRSFEDLVARLVSERNALLVAKTDGSGPRFFVVSPRRHAEAARKVCRLQSVPQRGVLVLDVESAPIMDPTVGEDDCVQTVPFGSSGALPDWLADADYLIPFETGDVLHPALGATLALRMATDCREAPAVWTWNVTGYRVDEAGRIVPSCFLRKPERPDAAWLVADVSGRAFAVRAGALRALGLTDLAHAFGRRDQQHDTLRALIRGGVDWRHHPEYFGLYEAQSWRGLMPPIGQDAQSELGPSLLSSAALESVDAAAPVDYCPRLRPAAVGDGISVIIPFRDKAAMTLEAVRSVAAQKAATWIEIILVNNQSRADELQAVHAGLVSVRRPGLNTVVIDYLHPFNHSRQCNDGARAATGATVVFLNNDATLDSAEALESFARWTGLPGVLTVSGRIVDKGGALQCAGLRTRQSPGTDYNSPMEESKDDVLAVGLKRVTGNSFACAAVRRDRFLSVGGLDEIEFPIGYNDVEFSLRTEAQGWSHLYLGWVQISHTPGSSRGSSDEILQKVLLRDRHHEVLRSSQYQLESDANFLKMALAKLPSVASPRLAAGILGRWNRTVAGGVLGEKR